MGHPERMWFLLPDPATVAVGTESHKRHLRHAASVPEPQPPPPASPRVLAHANGRLVYFPAWMRDSIPFQPGDRLVAHVEDNQVTLSKEP